jgi:hypothetical protein
MGEWGVGRPPTPLWWSIPQRIRVQDESQTPNTDFGQLVLKQLASWLVDEAADKLKHSPERAAKFAADRVKDWVKEPHPPCVPQQKNGYDCGVFTLVCMEWAALKMCRCVLSCLPGSMDCLYTHARR